MKFSLRFCVVILGVLLLDIAPYPRMCRGTTTRVNNEEPKILLIYCEINDEKVSEITVDGKSLRTVINGTRPITLDDVKEIDEYEYFETRKIVNTQQIVFVETVELPFEATEEDFLGYYQGYRNVVVLQIIYQSSSQDA